MRGVGAGSALVLLFVITCGASCGSGDDASTVRVGGTVSGLEGSGLVLDNGTEQLAISTNGAFTFSTAIMRGVAYDVRVATQPRGPDQICTVDGGSGVADDTSATSVVVTCGAAVFVTGTVRGLIAPSLVLELDGERLSVTANGAFTFPRPLALGTNFDVKVAEQPSGPSQACFVPNGTGVTDPATTVQVICSVPLGTLRSYRARNAYIKSDGTLWVWGKNDGYLGDGTTQNRLAPVQVGSNADWHSIDLDQSGGCATRTDGTLWCWGWGYFDGSIPTSSTPPTSSPAQIGQDTDWVSVATGSHHVCGLRANGTLWCWGNDDGGQLGIDAPTTHQMTPVQVGVDSDWITVTAGGGHTCATKLDGTAWCWGLNSVGTVGDGTTMRRNTPVQLPMTWSSISAGGSHTCGVRPDGSLWCWGHNESGQLGLGALTFSEPVPTRVGTESTWASVSANVFVTCAVRIDGSAWCWGDNTWGGLGDGTATRRTSPALVVGSQSWVSIAPGGGGSCGLDASSVVWCWGANGEGYLGLGTPGRRLTPAPVSGSQTWSTVSAAGTISCAIATDATLWCWGYIGFVDTYLYEVPTQIGSALWNDFAAGSHRCGVQQNGTLWCWGMNLYGELGTGAPSTEPTLVPTQVGSDTDWASVTLTANHTCARKSNGTIWCWGYGTRVGDGTTTQRNSPVQIGTDTDWVELEAGGARTCAIKSGGSLWCWGDNTFGAIGDGTSTNRYAPVQIAAPAQWKRIAPGGRHTCGIASDNTLWCWGDNEFGQIGYSGNSNRTPLQIGTANTWSRIAAGDHTTCAARSDATLWCWGANFEGAVGDGTTVHRFAPTLVGGVAAGGGAISVAGRHHCAISSSGTLSCTGSNSWGELGDGLSWHGQPMQVLP